MGHAPVLMTNERVLFLWVTVLSATCLILSMPAACQSEPANAPPGFHLLLRLQGDKDRYKLGEPVQVEIGCYSDVPEQYRAACAGGADDTVATLATLEVTPVDLGAKLAVDPVETRWIMRTLCRYSQTLFDREKASGSYPAVTGNIHWRSVTLTRHFPMSVGRFQVLAVTHGLRFTTLHAGQAARGEAFAASSAPVVISVVDDQQWRAAVIRQTMDALAKPRSTFSEAAFESELARIRYMPDLEVLQWMVSEFGYAGIAVNHPDRARVAKLVRQYLNDNIDGDSDHFKRTVHEALALELASDSPALYARAVRFQDVLGDPPRGDVVDLRAWLLPRYRRLMLDVGKSMATMQKCRFGSTDDSDLEAKAEDLVRLNVPDCRKARLFLSEKELRGLMRNGCLSPKFIDEQMTNMREAYAEAHKAE